MAMTVDRHADNTGVHRSPGRRRRVEGAVARWLGTYSGTALRVSLGLVFLGLGVLKFFPGAAPAEALVMRTVDALTFGVVSTAAVVVTAVVETFIGVTLVSGVGLRAGLAVLAGSLVGILSPVVLFAGDLFPGGLPTLEAQYVLKDVVLVTAAAVVAARALPSAAAPQEQRPGR
jgi:hypothetical protein